MWLPPVPGEPISRERALGLIAWLAVLSEISSDEISRAIEEVEDC